MIPVRPQDGRRIRRIDGGRGTKQADSMSRYTVRVNTAEADRQQHSKLVRLRWRGHTVSRRPEEKVTENGIGEDWENFSLIVQERVYAGEPGLKSPGRYYDGENRYMSVSRRVKDRDRPLFS